MSTRQLLPEEHFWAKTQIIPGSCWVWYGAINNTRVAANDPYGEVGNE